MNLILCGMMGAGKTSVGVRIAEKTGRRWYDTDQMIVDRYGNISDIFEYYGEEYFRKLESEIVKELAEKDHLIISTGGGLVLKRENNELLQANGKIVFLRASLQTLVDRLRVNDDRPLLQAKSGILADKLSELLRVRMPVYEHVADFIVDVDNKTVDETADEVVETVRRSNHRQKRRGNRESRPFAPTFPTKRRCARCLRRRGRRKWLSTTQASRCLSRFRTLPRKNGTGSLRSMCAARFSARGRRRRA